MKPPQADRRAAPGTVSAETLADLAILRDFLNRRDDALQRLFGRRLGRSHLRDEVLRFVVLEFGADRVRPIVYYQRMCLNLASPTATRDELRLISGFGVVLLEPRDERARQVLVWPSQRLVDWYNDHMPSLTAEAAALLRSRVTSSP